MRKFKKKTNVVKTWQILKLLDGLSWNCIVGHQTIKSVEIPKILFIRATHAKQLRLWFNSLSISPFKTRKICF